MPACDMCGKEAELVKALIERTELSVCRKCAGYGKIIKSIMPKTKVQRRAIPKKKKKEEIIELVVPEYSRIIREKREKMGMNQEDFSKKINEKESVLHHIETGHFVPPIALCRKLERILRVNLVEISKEGADGDEKGAGKQSGQKVSDTFTLGDFIKVRKR